MLPSTWRYKRFHVSYILAWLSLGVLGGLVLGRYASVPFEWFGTAIGVLLLIASLKSRRLTACVIALLAGLLIGSMRSSTFAEQLSNLEVYAGSEVTIRGVVTQDPVLQNGVDIWQSQLHRVVVDGTAYVGEIYATIRTEKVLRRGDAVTISAKAHPGFGNFQLSTYRADLISHERVNDIFLDARDTFAERVRRVMPEPEASLGLGFVVGQKSALPADLVEQLKIVGLTHIVVASGYNLTILVRFARRLLARKSRYLALVGSVVLVIGFVMISGLSPSMNRAAIVTILSLLAWYFGRQFHPVQLILYVASVSAFLYPLYIWSDLGWLLSFAAFTGILVVSPVLVRVVFRKQDTPSTLGRMVIETLSAELMTLPIVMVYFGYVPVFALLANLLVAPVIPFAMAATFIAGLVGMIIPAVAIIAAPASIVIAYVVASVSALSAVPWAQVTTDAAPVAALVWYGLLTSWLVLIWRHYKVDLRASSVVE